MYKKILSGITALAFVLSSVYVSPKYENNSVNIISVSAEEGQCGDNANWSYNSGTLTISGTGDMMDYHSSEALRSPFYSDSNIKSVVIEKGVTSIGAGAFEDCISLTNIIICRLNLIT